MEHHSGKPAKKKVLYRIPPARQMLPAVNDKDAMKKTIRTHLLIERGLISNIRKALFNPEALDVKALPFPVKVDLAIALGRISSDVKGALLIVNSLRNKFAHEPSTRLTRQMTDNLWKSLPLRIQKDLHETFKSRFSTQPKGMLTQVLGGLFFVACFPQASRRS
jgi:hypothetical protein